jgi:hypothetical protein
MLDFPALTAQLVWVSRQRSKRLPRLLRILAKNRYLLSFVSQKQEGISNCILCSRYFLPINMSPLRGWNPNMVSTSIIIPPLRGSM